MAARKNQIIELLLWLAGASVALAASILCLTVASNGKINAIALVPFVWTVAMFAGAVRAVPAVLPADVLARSLGCHFASAPAGDRWSCHSMPNSTAQRRPNDRVNSRLGHTVAASRRVRPRWSSS